jgi:membrane protein
MNHPAHILSHGKSGGSAAAAREANSPTQIPPQGWKEVALRTWHESTQDNIGIVAAGVAFYGFLAMVPLLGASVLTYGLFADPQSVVRHAQSLTSMLPADVAKLIGQQLLNVVHTSGGKKGLGLIVALAIAFWGARNAASSVVTALNIAYEEKETRSFVRVTLLSLEITAGAVVMALLVAGAVGLLAALQDLVPGLGTVGVILGKVITYLFLAAVAAAAAATMFRYGPARHEAKWKWITPGSVFFAAVWILLTLGFGFYVANFGNYGATYGSLSAVIVLLTWLYLSSYVLLLGAELNSELEKQTAKDTTVGAPQPLGQRNASSADQVAAGKTSSGSADNTSPLSDEPSAPSDSSGLAKPAPASSDHPYLTSRATARAGHLAGLRHVGMVSSILATLGLSKLRRRGSEATGAALLLSAAGLSLLKRKD